MQKNQNKKLEALFAECDEVSASAQIVIDDDRQFVAMINLELAFDWWMRFLFWAQWKPLFPTLH